MTIGGEQAENAKVPRFSEPRGYVSEVRAALHIFETLSKILDKDQRRQRSLWAHMLAMQRNA